MKATNDYCIKQDTEKGNILLNNTNIESTSPSNYVLTLTRSCSQKCDFCAVDAYGDSIEDCIQLAGKKQKIGEELTVEQWLKVVDKILADDPHTRFDLSGGDCLLLPWVRHEFIPSLMKRVKKEQVSITATAESIELWMEELQYQNHDNLPGTIHLTYDGVRDYSFKNMELAKKLIKKGFDIHFECPLTKENCIEKNIRNIFSEVLAAGVSEILLMRYFPVGRGANAEEVIKNQPTDKMYELAIREFKKYELLYKKKLKLKVQCSLKYFDKESPVTNACKMGKTTWCVMPNGDLLICPWAYGLGGKPLHSSLITGNLLKQSINECHKIGLLRRQALNHDFPNKCKIFEYVKLTNTKGSNKTNPNGGSNE